ncbi:MAG: hypothetical protein JJ992_23830, partial [Planctomycetes bacterium]|nr:hypothetical protein [Planctomycetota bacterium]
MSLIIVLLMVIAALAVAIRILDSRRTAGTVLLGVATLLLLGSATVVLTYLASGSTVNMAASASEQASPANALAEAENEAAEADTGNHGGLAEKSVGNESFDDLVSHTPTIDAGTETAGVVIPPRPAWVESDDV